ncbi:hypothetical protein DET59_1124 [Rossellomorea aquimaris]|uniref:Uncharacterized protein n=1 Tax=Rossellomorea aquimaris TaxID=189382 RepID=A0A366ELW0_9BACI|nr:hypothetical protein DET59_1124 [Rossellomorea aquimaris]
MKQNFLIRIMVKEFCLYYVIFFTNNYGKINNIKTILGDVL